MIRPQKLGLLIGLLITGVILAACGGAPVAEEAAVSTDPLDLGGREVSIMVENEYPPFNSIDPDTDEGVGWDYDVWREICSRLNCEPVFVEAAWPPFEMMAAGELDVAADGITLKLGRSMVVDFSDPYIEYGMVMMMRTDNVFETAEDFAAADTRISSQAGTTNEAAALALVGEDRVVDSSAFFLGPQQSGQERRREQATPRPRVQVGHGLDGRVGGGDLENRVGLEQPHRLFAVLIAHAFPLGGGNLCGRRIGRQVLQLHAVGEKIQRA